MNAFAFEGLQIVIMGGGVSGAATAWNLARRQPAADILVVEPRHELGRGLAYSSTDPAHRINVPAAKMSIDPDAPTDFVDWLASPAGPLLDPASLTRKGDLFPPRDVFGSYMAQHLAPFVHSGAIRHCRALVQSVRPALGRTGFTLSLSDQSTLHADILVIATSHPPPEVPASLLPLAGSPRIIANPYDMDRVLSIGAAERVLIVGSGLTSADVIASLERRGFWGQVHRISRHGYRSQGHGIVTRESEAEFWRSAQSGASALVRHVRRAVAEDAAQGQGWHAVFDRLRADGPRIWRSLDALARARFVRHLRALWDVHRFRIAPQVQEVLDRWEQRGLLHHQAARLIEAVETDRGIEVTLRPRGAQTVETRTFDRIIVTTGPAHGAVLARNPALGSLAAAALVTADQLGLGLSVARGCHAVSADGSVSDRLLVVGPLARGDVGELMGLPEVTRHAKQVAEEIIGQMELSIAAPVPEARA